MKRLLAVVALLLIVCSAAYGNVLLEWTEKLRYQKGNTAKARFIAASIEEEITPGITIGLLELEPDKYVVFMYSDVWCNAPCATRKSGVRKMAASMVSIGGEIFVLANDAGMFNMAYIEGRIVSPDCE